MAKKRSTARRLKRPYPPMEAKAVAEAPEGAEWQYEPKWDGFRCLIFRDGDKVYLQSKSGRPLARYFPDIVAAAKKIRARRFVLDGEIVIPVAGRLSFDELLLRVHPAASRVATLSKAHPAMYVVFDLLSDEQGAVLVKEPLEVRRQRLEAFVGRFARAHGSVRLSPATTSLKEANRWFKAAGGNLDGIVAKRRDLAYRSGERDGMQKVKHRRTVDCVVGGFRYAKGKRVVGSLLLGLYDSKGVLHHVGFTSSFTQQERPRVTKIVLPLKGASAFDGRSPGRPSRWSTRESDRWQPLRARLVVEVEYDHFTGGRFRHGTSFVRWRPDKDASACTLDQVERGRGSTLRLLSGGAGRRGRGRRGRP